jgi:MFS family permease
MRAVQIVLMMGVGVFLFNHGLNNWLPEMLRSHGLPIVEASYWAAIPTVIGVVGSLLIPRLATPERRFRILLALSVAALLSSVFLQFVAGPWLTLGLIMQGIVRSGLTTVLILSLVELPGIGASRAGTASGLFFSAAEVGGMLGPLGMGMLYDASGNFHGALAGLSAVAILLTIGTLRLRRLTPVPQRCGVAADAPRGRSARRALGAWVTRHRLRSGSEAPARRSVQLQVRGSFRLPTVRCPAGAQETMDARVVRLEEQPRRQAQNMAAPDIDDAAVAHRHRAATVLGGHRQQRVTTRSRNAAMSSTPPPATTACQAA